LEVTFCLRSPALSPPSNDSLCPGPAFCVLHSPPPLNFRGMFFGRTSSSSSLWRSRRVTLLFFQSFFACFFQGVSQRFPPAPSRRLHRPPPFHVNVALPALPDLHLCVRDGPFNFFPPSLSPPSPPAWIPLFFCWKLFLATRKLFPRLLPMVYPFRPKLWALGGRASCFPQGFLPVF